MVTRINFMAVTPMGHGSCTLVMGQVFVDQWVMGHK